jgi:hypothetical protein
MLRKLRARLSFANVTSLLALFVALGGTSAYAINEWTGANIVDESLTGADVRGKQGTASTPAVNGSLTTQDIAGQQANAANGTPFIDGTLTQWDIKNASVAAADLAPNSVNSSKVTDSSLTAADLAPNSVNSSEVLDNSLTGADVNEAGLGQVPSAQSAQLGGTGRFAGRSFSSPRGDQCDPDDLALVTCIVVEINLPAPARVLLVGGIEAFNEIGSDDALGNCVLSTPAGAIAGSAVRVQVDGSFDETEWVPLTIVTPFTLGPGLAQFGLACNEDPLLDDIQYDQPRISAVALSPN